MSGAGNDKTLGEAYGPQFENMVVWMLLFDSDFAETAYAVFEAGMFEKVEYQVLFSVGKSVFTRLANTPPGAQALIAEVIAATKACQPKTIRRLQLVRALREIKTIRKAQPSSGDVAYVNNAVSGFVTRAKMRDALLAAGDMWEQKRYDEIVEAVEAAAHGQARGAGSGEGVLFNNTKDKLKMYLKATRNSSKKAALGIPLLDKQMRGGLEEGNLAVVMAPAKRGKSQFLVNAGAHALMDGLNVAVISCELPARDYSLRFDARLTGIPINEIAMHPSKHAKKIINATSKLKSSLYIKEYGSNSATVGDIYVWLKTLKSRRGFIPDLVIVDYADLLNTTKRKRDAPDLGAIYRALRQLAFDFNTRVWTASQTNRGSYHGKRVSLQDVAEDLQKIQIADVIIGVGQTQREFDAGRSRLMLLGNRLGGGEGLTVDCISRRETMELIQAKNQPVLGRANIP